MSFKQSGAFMYRALFRAVFSLIMAATGVAHAADVSGRLYEDRAPAPAKDGDFNLAGDTVFGWQTGTITGNVNLNDHALTMQTGGGNPTTFSGVLSGTGSFHWLGGTNGTWLTTPSYLNGEKANTLTGTFTLEQGMLVLAKLSGVDAIAGPLVVGGTASAILQW